MPAESIIALLPADAEERLRTLAERMYDAAAPQTVEDIAGFVLDLDGDTLHDGGDVAYLLVLLIEQAKRIAALEAGLRPFAEVARDFHVEPDELRAFVGAALPVIGDFRTAALLLEPR